MKIVNSYNEYLTACRAIEESAYYTWTPQVSYKLLTKESLRDLLLSQYDLDGVLKLIIVEVLNNYNIEYTKGKLIGIELTNEDYYYILEKEGKMIFETCVGKLE